MNSSVSPVRMEENQTLYVTFQVFWLVGIAVSVLCLVLQITCFILIRCSRKMDEKILAQITFTRILVTLCEYYMLYIPRKTIISNDIMFPLYFTSDFALVCLMLVFSKNLYDKIVIVFSIRKLNLIYTSLMVWAVSLAFGVTGIYVLKYTKKTYFSLYYNIIFASVKFMIVTINLLVYVRIFYVAFRRGSERNRNVRDFLKTAFVAFLLVTTMCLQILITDLIAYGRNVPKVLIKTFCIINSFHAVLISIIFIIILKSKMSESIVKTMSLRLTELVT